MVEFKLAIGDSKTKRTFKTELKSPDADQLLGKKIGDKFRGELIGLTGYEFEITGGSDNAGFPMKPDMEGVGRRKLLLSDGFGFHAERHGQRKRRSVRGNTISNETVQINCKITKWGEADLLKHFGIVKEEKPAEEKKEEKPAKEIEDKATKVADVPTEQEKKEEEKPPEPAPSKPVEA